MSESRSGPALRRPLAFVGLPGAGKSTVGRAVAARLGVPFVDFDERLTAESGQSISQLFAEQGEAAFRKMEFDLTDRLLAEPPAVWAPGGGWVTAPGVLARIGGKVSMIHLVVRPESALARLDRDANVRPLLAGADPERTLARLLSARLPAWRSADLVLDTDRLDLPDLVDAACDFARRVANSPDRP